MPFMRPGEGHFSISFLYFYWEFELGGAWETGLLGKDSRLHLKV